jgi:hypothetical protein
MISGGIIPIQDLPYDTNGKGSPHVIYEGMQYYCNIGYPWLTHPKVVKLRYEDFTRRTVETLLDAFAQVDIEISEDNIREVSTNHNFANITGGRIIGTEDKSAHFRKGIIGDYKNYFTDQHRAMSKYFIGEDLIRLSYENDYNW